MFINGDIKYMFYLFYRFRGKLEFFIGLVLYMNCFIVNIMNNLMNKYCGKIINNF